MKGPAWFSDLTAVFLYVVLIATIGPLLFGFHLAELNAPQDVISCRRKAVGSSADPSKNLPQCIHMSQVEIGLINSIFTLGGLCGALVAGPAASRFGRLTAMRVNTVFLILGPVAESLAPNVGVMATGRFISGIGAGAAVVVAPIFVSEIAPPAKKGFFGSFTQVMINFGIFSAQLLGLFLSRGQLWRIILAVGGVFGIVQLLGLIGCVESPAWHAEKGRISVAKAILQHLRGDSIDISDEVAAWSIGRPTQGEERALLDADVDETHHSVPGHETGNDSGIGILQVMTNSKYRRATLTVMVVMVAQQLCGINSIVFYGVSLLSDLLTTSSALLNVCVALFNLVVTLTCAPLIDSLGRKPCLMGSVMGMGGFALLLGIAILSHIRVLSVISVLGFVGSFGLGLGAIPFMLSSELVGPEAVGATQSWALAANWIATFVVAQFFPIVNKALGKGKVYFVFTALAVGFTAFIAWFVPETKGKQDAEEVWNDYFHKGPSRDHAE